METKDIIFVVKFDCGYYADRQSHYSWDFTDDVGLAKKYKTEEAAHERAQTGLHLVMNRLKTACVEKYEMKTIFTKFQ